MASATTTRMRSWIRSVSRGAGSGRDEVSPHRPWPPVDVSHTAQSDPAPSALCAGCGHDEVSRRSLDNEVRQSESNLLEMMTALGSQIGQFIERKRVEEALRRSEAYLAEAQRLSYTGTIVFNAAGPIYWSQELRNLEFGSKARSSPPRNCTATDTPRRSRKYK